MKRPARTGGMPFAGMTTATIRCRFRRSKTTTFRMKRRIYTDTSVIGGCLDVEYEEASQLLMGAFKRGEATMVLSSLTSLELLSAPADVRAVVEEVPKAHREYVEMTAEAAMLAEHYMDSRVIGPANRVDAQHIAIATANRVDVLVSWNFKHIVNLRRIQAYNSVNLREGYPTLEIRTPREAIDHGEN